MTKHINSSSDTPVTVPESHSLYFAVGEILQIAGQAFSEHIVNPVEGVEME